MINERRLISDISYHEDEVKLAKKMMDTLRTTMEFLYYLMDHRHRTTLSMLLISTEDLNIGPLLHKSKRDTDILFEIDKEKQVYVLICQSTNYIGAEKFAEILLSNVHMHGGHNTYCVGAELQSTENTIQEVIFKMVERYINIKYDKRSEEVFFIQL